MKYRYELSELAKKDVEDIWEYSAFYWSIQQANFYYELIFAEIDQICQHPNQNKPMDYINLGHKARLVKSHIIIYKVLPPVIYIDRILHQKMDIDTKLKTSDE
jgi:toxin ParE1/3/4